MYFLFIVSALSENIQEDTGSWRSLGDAQGQTFVILSKDGLVSGNHTGHNQALMCYSDVSSSPLISPARSCVLQAYIACVFGSKAALVTAGIYLFRCLSINQSI